MDVQTVEQMGDAIASAQRDALEMIVIASGLIHESGDTRLFRVLAENIPGYATQTIKRWGLVAPFWGEIQIPADFPPGVIWAAFLTASERDSLDIVVFRRLIEEAISKEYSVGEAKEAWGLTDDKATGMLFSAQAERRTVDVDGAPRDALVMTEAVPPETPANVRVKVWEG